MVDEAQGYGEFRRGWRVVLSSMLGIGLGLSPVPFYTIGIFAPELVKEFGWNYGQIMLGISFTTAGVVLASPLVGLLADRFGVRIVTLVSIALFGLSFMTFALTSGSLVQYYATWVLVAFLGAGTLPITWTRAVNNWFDRRKGFALGLCLLGTGLFGYLGKPFTAAVLADYGWRTAYVAIGALPLLIALPVAYFYFFDVGPVGQSAAERRASEADRVAAMPGLSKREILLSWRFAVIAGTCLMIAFVIGGAIPNMENILKLAGFQKPDIIPLTSLIGLSVIVGRIAGGWFLDRFWAPGVAVVLLGAPSLACWLLAQGVHGYNEAAFCIILIGFAAGVEYDLMAFLVARYFGMKSYNVVYGALYGFFSAGAGIGPYIFGHLYDDTGSYREPLLIACAFLIASVLGLLTLGRYRRFA